MNKTGPIIITSIIFVITGAILIYLISINEDENDIEDNPNTVEEEFIPESELVSIQSDELYQLMKSRDILLIDVHVPEQDHIAGTDKFIDYQKIEESADQLPEKKDTEIVVYCRTHTMSKTAAASLIKMGYTNVKYLEGGINSWRAWGYPIDEDSIGKIN